MDATHTIPSKITLWGTLGLALNQFRLLNLLSASLESFLNIKKKLYL